MADYSYTNNLFDKGAASPRDKVNPRYSDKFQQHFYDPNAQRSNNIENRNRTSPDERQVYSDEYVRNLLEIMNEYYSIPAVPLPRPRPDPSILQGLNEDVRAFKYAKDMAGSTYDNSQDLSVTPTTNTLAKKANSAYWNFEPKPTFFSKNADQYIAAGQFLIDSFKRARTVGFPIHPLEPVLHGLSTTSFTTGK